LWRRGLLLQCPTRKDYPGCRAEGMCCGKAILRSERGFASQKGLIQEALEYQNQKVVLFPKFHCELNPIESYWCKAKWYARENCDYILDGLREMIPKALDSVEKKSIRGYFARTFRIVKAYRDNVTYGTEEFKGRVQKTHRRLEDRTKW